MDGIKKIDLSQIGIFLRGKGITKTDLTDSGIPCLRYAEIYTSFNDVVTRLNSVVSKEAALRATPIHNGDIIFATSGETAEEIGKAVAYLGNDPAVAGGDTVIFREHGQDPCYLAYALNSQEAVKQKARLGKGNSVVHIHAKDLGEIRVPLPPLPEQRKITEVLRTWDEAIEKLEVLKAAKERCRNWLCSHLISLGEQDAPHVTFGEFLTESREQGANGVTARKISVKLYGKGAIEKPGSRTGSKNTRYYRRSAGQLVYSKLDFLNGAFAIVDQALDGFESTLDLPAFDVSPEVNVKWLIEYLTRPAFYSQQVHLARGQRKARRIAPDDFLASYVRLPNQTEQDRIVEILAQADHELSLEVQTLKLIRDQKRGLMQKLLTGEWRVAVEGRCE